MSIKFFDGKSSTSRVVELVFLDSGSTVDKGNRNFIFELVDTETEEKFIFNVEDLVVLEYPSHNRPGVISDLEHKIRIVIPNRETFNQAASLIPRRKLFSISPKFFAISLLLLGVYFYFSMDKLVELVPNSFEQKLARKTIQQITRESEYKCDDQEALLLISELTSQLRMNSTKPIKIHVYKNEMVNAFATTDGNLVFFSGFLNYIESEEEFLGVFSHELAHSIKKHPLKGYLRGMGINLFFTVLFGTGIEANLGSFLIQNQYTQTYETEADVIGSEMLNKMQYTNQGLRTFLTIDSSQSDFAFLKYLSTHPPSKERINLLEEINKVDKRRNILSKEKWLKIKHTCDKPPSPSSPFQ